jgi:hypothetical protein
MTPPAAASILRIDDDLEFVLDHIDWHFDAEDDPGTMPDTELAVQQAMTALRWDILIRRNVKAGRLADTRYCGVDNGMQRACGASLGLPDCDVHEGRPLSKEGAL